MVGRAIASGKRQIIVCDNIELRGRLHSAVKALCTPEQDLASTRATGSRGWYTDALHFTVGQPAAASQTTANNGA